MNEKILQEVRNVEINSEEDLDKVEEIFEKYSITQYKIDYDCAYDSCGEDVCYYCIAYVYDDELEMVTGTYEC